MRYALYLLLAVFFIRCADEPNNDSLDDSVNERMMDSCKQALKADSVEKQMIHLSHEIGNYNNDSAWLAEVKACDTVTPNGSFIKHHVDSIGEVYVYWGSSSTGIVDTMLDESGGYAGPCLLFMGETEKYLVVYTQSLGYISTWLLPSNENDTVTNYTGVIGIDFENSLVLTPDGHLELKLTNFSNGKSVHFKPKSLHAGIYGLYEIYTVRFSKDAVYLEWDDEDGKKHSMTQKL